MAGVVARVSSRADPSAGGRVMFEGILQPGHLLLILFVALLVFGPKKLPILPQEVGLCSKASCRCPGCRLPSNINLPPAEGWARGETRATTPAIAPEKGRVNAAWCSLDRFRD